MTESILPPGGIEDGTRFSEDFRVTEVHEDINQSPKSSLK